MVVPRYLTSDQAVIIMQHIHPDFPPPVKTDMLLTTGGKVTTEHVRHDGHPDAQRPLTGPTADGVPHREVRRHQRLVRVCDHTRERRQSDEAKQSCGEP